MLCCPRRGQHSILGFGFNFAEVLSWQTYQAMLTDMGDHRASRLTYDEGTLEIKRPPKLHEIINRLIEVIITAKGCAETGGDFAPTRFRAKLSSNQ